MTECVTSDPFRSVEYNYYLYVYVLFDYASCTDILTSVQYGWDFITMPMKVNLSGMQMEPRCHTQPGMMVILVIPRMGIVLLPPHNLPGVSSSALQSMHIFVRKLLVSGITVSIYDGKIVSFIYI